MWGVNKLKICLTYKQLGDFYAYFIDDPRWERGGLSVVGCGFEVMSQCRAMLLAFSLFLACLGCCRPHSGDGSV